MKTIEASVTIRATQAVVWATLTDPAALVAGGLGLLLLTGDLRRGGRLRLISEVAPKRAFALRVADFAPDRRMVWTSGMPLGLFRGVRTFTLAPSRDGTEFAMVEVFGGLLLPLIWKSMPDLRPGFQQFATGLKRLAEGG